MARTILSAEKIFYVVFPMNFLEFLLFFWGGWGRHRTSNFWLVVTLTLKVSPTLFSGACPTTNEETWRSGKTVWGTSASYHGLWGQARPRDLTPDVDAQCSGIRHLGSLFSSVKPQIFIYEFSPLQAFPLFSFTSYRWLNNIWDPLSLTRGPYEQLSPQHS